MEERATRIKRLIYQSWYRGCKETDRLLGYFAKEHLESMSDAELDEFESLLKEEDREIFLWLTGQAPIPSRYSGSKVLKSILAYDLAGKAYE